MWEITLAFCACNISNSRSAATTDHLFCTLAQHVAWLKRPDKPYVSAASWHGTEDNWPRIKAFILEPKRLPGLPEDHICFDCNSMKGNWDYIPQLTTKFNMVQSFRTRGVLPHIAKVCASSATAATYLQGTRVKHSNSVSNSFGYFIQKQQLEPRMLSL